MARVVLAYSGGLDTSICIHWMKAKKGLSTVAFAADIGQGGDPAELERRALAAGAEKAYVLDMREEFVRDFVFPAIKANAVYESGYPLNTALGRPLIAKGLVQVAHKEGIDTIAHGCTGKGNDQVRIEVGVASLDPRLKAVAPLREWEFRSREEEIDYAEFHNIRIPVTRAKPYSIDRNLWGVSVECGQLEDPWNAPPRDAYQITTDPLDAPNKPEELVVGFNQGVPVSLNGKALGGIELIQTLNQVGGAHGVGRHDVIENRYVGIKSREVYEAPAAAILLAAHRAIEDLVLSKGVRDAKEALSQQFANLIYAGQWFTDLRECLEAFLDRTQVHVTGEARVRLYKGSCVVAGRRAPLSLYDRGLATYSAGDTFQHRHAEGFLHICSLPGRAEGARRAKAGDRTAEA
jgi:argininosuccinate synthase